MTTITEICTKPDGTINNRAIQRIQDLYDNMGDELHILNKLSQTNLTLERTELGSDILRKVRAARNAFVQLKESLDLVDYEEDRVVDAYDEDGWDVYSR